MNALEQLEYLGRLAVKCRMTPIPPGAFVERWPGETPIAAIRHRAMHAKCHVKIDSGAMEWVLIKLEVVA